MIICFIVVVNLNWRCKCVRQNLIFVETLHTCWCTNKCHHSCFLVTYFCTERIIGDRQDGIVNTVDKKSFINTYGAYLHIQTCLAFASYVKDDAVISDILRIATEDPNHQDNLKAIKKSVEIFYDSVSQVFSDRLLLQQLYSF